MRTKAFVLTAISSFSMLAADPYGQYSCPGGNCPYQGQGSGQSYYQGPSQPYYQGSSQPYYQGQGQGSRQSYYQGGQGTSDSYYQGNPSSNYMQNQNQPYYPNNAQRPAQYQNSPREQYNQNPQYSTQDRDNYYNPSNSSNDYSNPNSPNNPSYSNNSGYMSDKNTPKTTKIVTDEEIAKQVHEAVSSNWLSSGYPEVTFDVNNGTVNLRGNVKTQDEKIKLESAVKKIDGVKQVNNQVSVVEAKTASNSYGRNNIATNDSKMRKNESSFPKDTAATDSDRLINSKIRNKLSSWFGNGYETIVLNTSNGIVTITGYVEKADDIQKINKDAKAVDGVKTVNNNVTLQRK